MKTFKRYILKLLNLLLKRDQKGRELNAKEIIEKSAYIFVARADKRLGNFFLILPALKEFGARYSEKSKHLLVHKKNYALAKLLLPDWKIHNSGGVLNWFKFLSENFKFRNSVYIDAGHFHDPSFSGSLKAIFNFSEFKIGHDHEYSKIYDCRVKVIDDLFEGKQKARLFGIDFDQLSGEFAFKNTQKKKIFFHPGASSSERRISEKNFPIFFEFKKETIESVIFLEEDKEHLRSDQLKEWKNSSDELSCFKAFPAMSRRDILESIKDCDLAICSHSGVYHMAMYLGLPVILLSSEMEGRYLWPSRKLLHLKPGSPIMPSLSQFLREQKLEELIKTNGN